MPLASLPPPCQTGDRVAVVAPASPFRPELLFAGCDLLQEWGLQPVYEARILDRWGYLAGRDEHRQLSLERAFADPSFKAVLCARGGYGIHRLLPRLDLPALAQANKRFVGFSDITLLHQALHQHSPTITFHGPMVASEFFIEGTPESQRRLRQALFASDVESLFPPVPGDPLQQGRATGPLVGGNLAMIVSSMGTPWQINTQGAILFLEEVGEPPFRIDRMFQQLRLSGLLDPIAGLALGDFGSLRDQYDSYEQRDFWCERLGLPSCPVLANLPAGHVHDNYTLPLGATVTLDATEGDLRLPSPGEQPPDG